MIEKTFGTLNDDDLNCYTILFGKVYKLVNIQYGKYCDFNSERFCGYYVPEFIDVDFDGITRGAHKEWRVTWMKTDPITIYKPNEFAIALAVA